MSYAVHIEHFDGPLDLLLQLVESEKMEITNVSLLQVTEPFVAHVREHQGTIPPEELADFLVIAAKLVYLKSRALLPSLTDPALEEGPDLETQLRMYKAFAEAAKRLGEMAKLGVSSYSRAKRPMHEIVAGFVPPIGVSTDLLRELYQRIIRRLEPVTALPKAALERALSLEEKIRELTDRVRQALRLSFHRVLAEAGDRAEMVVSFLALLELMKQRLVKVKQSDLFEEIHLEAIS
jgi:segregation and condensation protein A